MRLTLRALLNWINENLPPEDAEAIAQKVAGSELATSLKAQIQEVMRIQHLPAPPMLDGTPLGNPNTAAEYLDNVMAPERTPEFEKFCIHSETVLGEVASCHQILSTLLVENVEVSPGLSSRMYNLFNLYNQEANAITHMAGADQAPEIDFAKLAAEAPKRLPWLVYGLGAIVLLLVVWIIILMASPRGKQTAVGPEPDAVSVAQESAQPDTASEARNVETAPRSEPPRRPAGAKKSTSASDTATAQPALVAEPEPAPESETLPEPEDTEVEAPLEDAAPAQPLDEDDDDPAEAEEPETPDVAEGAEVAQPDADSEPFGPEESARVVASNHQILLALPGDTDTWDLALPGDTLGAEVTFMATVGLASALECCNGLSVELKEESEIRITRSETELELALKYGRAVFRAQNVGAGALPCVVDVGSVRFWLEPGAWVAVQLKRGPGAANDPLGDATMLVELYLISGDVVYEQDSESDLVRYQAGFGPRLIAASEKAGVRFQSTSLEQLPVWAVLVPAQMEGSPMSLRDALASDDKGLMMSLYELAESRMKSVRTHARWILCQMGDSMSLQDLGKSARTRAGAERKMLQKTIQLSPEHANAVRAAVGSEAFRVITGR